MNFFKKTFLVLIVLNFLSINLAYGGLFKQDKKIEASETKKEKREEVSYKGKAVYLELEGDSVTYDQKNNIYITEGMSIAKLVEQDSSLEADKITYFGQDQMVEATGNVKITREGVVTTGELFNFDVTSDKYLLTNPTTTIKGAVVTARKVTNPNKDELEYETGTVQISDPVKVAYGFGVDKRPRTFYSQQVRRKLLQKPVWEDLPANRKYRLTAKKIVYDNTKKYKNLVMYRPRVQFDKFSIPLGPRLTTTASDDPNVMSRPLITPLAGTIGTLKALNIGPMFNFNLTSYHILSLTPFFQVGNSDEGFGLGGLVGFLGPSTKFELAYGSVENRFVGEFTQKIGKRTQLRAYYNQFADEGFLGSQLASVNVGIVDKRGYNPKFIKKITENGLRFRTEANYTEGDKEIFPSNLLGILNEQNKGEKFEDKAFKFEEQVSFVSKPIFKVGTDKFNTALRIRSRNAFRVYSTGDAQAILTAGPILGNNWGPFSFEFGYDQGFVEGKSPLFYDQYLEGMQSLSFDGDIKLCEYVSVGGYGTYNLKDAELIRKQFRAKVGPKDFKLLVNYDALNQQVQFGVNFLFGRPIDYERFLIQNNKRVN